MEKIDELVLSESLLLVSLKEKSALKSMHNDYIDIFFNFKKKVSQETKFIVQNFPEYTPHDEEYHLKRLLALGENLLGATLIASLNATELLVLCLSIYGHDWGMAVSSKEKQAISYSSIVANSGEFALLNLEGQRFAKHLEKLGEDNTAISDFAWQEYIRLTHAERSAQRVREYFKNTDNGFGEATARVCLGHWLDFKEVRDQSVYPSIYMVRGESINLRAVTLYLRLIDLFDISNERTPYTIYKYTAPQSMRSQMEWAKHRAVNSLAATEFQDGRVIQVDGQTDDYQVYAALEDLRTFCDKQLFGCNELLHELHDNKYNLNIFDLKWNIRPVGFDPISIKFQFDRTRMFEVLSDEIYKGDKYVFIRELLQNGIDAIKLRKEWIEKKTSLTLASFGEIRIEVQHSGSDNITVVFSDDGIGMDKYVIENYLSIAGKSYYSSDEFKKLGLEMDPISRFGVGILSCFMVADKIQINTLRDTMIQPDAKALRIDIPYVDQQFRISANNPVNEKPGTTIITYVSKDKIRNKLGGDGEIDITGYLKKLAGFVEFPIVIIENYNKTVIVNPFEDLDFFSKKYPGYKIHKLNTDLEFGEAFLPQSLKLARETFTTQQFTIEGDLGIDGVVGSITYIVPKDPLLKIREANGGWPTTDFALISSEKRNQDKRIKLSREHAVFGYANMPPTYKYGPSSFSNVSYKVYLDGILIPKANPPHNIEGEGEVAGHPYLISYFPQESFVVPFVVAKFLKKKLRNIDLSRAEVREKDFSWDTDISEKLFKHIISINRKHLLAEDLKERITYFAQLIFFYRIPITILIAEIRLDNCPLVMIENGGEVKFQTWGELVNKEIYLQPEHSYWFKQSVLERFDETFKKNEHLCLWKSDGFIVQDIFYRELNSEYTSSSQAILATQLFQFYLSETHEFDSFRFISSPWIDGPPLIQQVWVPKSPGKPLETSDLISKASDNIDSIQRIELENFLYTLFDKLENTHFNVFPKIGVFQAPFEDCLAYGVGILNFNHPFTKRLLRILTCIQRYDEAKEISVAWAKLIDKVLELPFFFDKETYCYSEFSLVEINLIIKEINEMVKDGELIKKYQQLEEIELKAFIEESVIQIDDEVDKYYQFFNNINLGDYEINMDYPVIMG